jgi:hypothetical protein
MGRIFKIVFKVHTLKGTASQTEKKFNPLGFRYKHDLSKRELKLRGETTLNVALVVSNFGQV